MDNNGQNHRAAVVNCKAANQRHGGNVLKGFGELINLLHPHLKVHHAPQDAVGAQRKDKGGHLHYSHAPTIHQANDYTNQDTHQKGHQPVGAVLNHGAHHRGHQSHIGTYRYINLPYKNGKRHSYGDKRINHRGVEAGAYIGRGQEGGVDDAHNEKQRHQKQKAGGFPRLQDFFLHTHAPTPSFSKIPKAAAVRLSWLMLSWRNSALSLP